MTEHNDLILSARERLGEEALDTLPTSLYLHKNKEDNYFQVTYASGRSVKQHVDKRKKDEVTYV